MEKQKWFIPTTWLYFEACFMTMAPSFSDNVVGKSAWFWVVLELTPYGKMTSSGGKTGYGNEHMRLLSCFLSSWG